MTQLSLREVLWNFGERRPLIAAKVRPERKLNSADSSDCRCHEKWCGSAASGSSAGGRLKRCAEASPVIKRAVVGPDRYTEIDLFRQGQGISPNGLRNTTKSMTHSVDVQKFCVRRRLEGTAVFEE
jgi:hypothetical protein